MRSRAAVRPSTRHRMRSASAEQLVPPASRLSSLHARRVEDPAPPVARPVPYCSIWAGMLDHRRQRQTLPRWVGWCSGVVPGSWSDPDVRAAHACPDRPRWPMRIRGSSHPPRPKTLAEPLIGSAPAASAGVPRQRAAPRRSRRRSSWRASISLGNRRASRRAKFIGRRQSYHGNTLGALAVGRQHVAPRGSSHRC